MKTFTIRLPEDVSEETLRVLDNIRHEINIGNHLEDLVFEQCGGHEGPYLTEIYIGVKP